MGYGKIFWGDLMWIGESVKASKRKGYLRQSENEWLL